MIILKDLNKAFRALTKDYILQPYRSDNDFRSSNDGNDIGYNLYGFDKRYHKNIEYAQTVNVEFAFSEKVPAGIK